MSVDSPALILKDRIESIRHRIEMAALRSGRTADAVRIVAATKTVTVPRIMDAARFGIAEIGENKVQEASAKRDQLGSGPPLTHHFIGQLQTNKARRAVELFDVIQSVDRPRIAESIDRAAREVGKRQRCLLEVKISPDELKGGASPDEVSRLLDFCRGLPGLEVEGLMGIAPFDAPEEDTRAAFRLLRKIFEAHRSSFGSSPVLSMGMTDDFEMAVEEGSTMVRIGRALFGERVVQ